MSNIIGYKLDDIGVSLDEIPRLSECDFHYDFFRGTAIMRIEEVDFSTKWNWITLLDFFYCNLKIINRLQKNNDLTFHYAELGHEISYRRTENNVLTVSSTYTDDIAETNFHEFRNDLESSYRGLMEDIMTRFPAMKQNPEFSKFMRIIDL
ncbi:hypothetical protein [Sessilibacter corallicola]|uniref:GSKIP domain-containing protein n=1 Tax=Sessilibacter corallicola TaxID=2904075 RepID=A0ABQ0AA00_9GAMM